MSDENKILSHLTDMVIHSRRTALEQGAEAPICAGLRFANGLNSGLAFSFPGVDEPIPLIRQQMITLAIALRPVAFVVMFEAWALELKGMTEEQMEAMCAMRRRGALPRISQDSRRVEMLCGVRGDFRSTQQTATRIKGDGEAELLQWSEVPEAGMRTVPFTLIPFDDETLAKGAAKLGRTTEDLTEHARAKLLVELGLTSAMQLLIVAEAEGEELERMRKCGMQTIIPV